MTFAPAILYIVIDIISNSFETCINYIQIIRHSRWKKNVLSDFNKTLTYLRDYKLYLIILYYLLLRFVDLTVSRYLYAFMKKYVF